MPYTTVVTGTTITASWGNANVRDQVVTPFANAGARSSAITVPVEGMVSFLNDVNSLEVYNGTVWVPTGPAAAFVNASETTTSTTYTDLTTAGPSVSVVTGPSALVWLNAALRNNTAGNQAFMGYAVSGASTSAAGDSQAISVQGTSLITAGGCFKATGLTPGTNVFTAKYRVDATTGTWQFRNITVLPLP